MSASAVSNTANLASQIRCEQQLGHHHRPVIRPESTQHASSYPYPQSNCNPGKNEEYYGHRQHLRCPALSHSHRVYAATRKRTKKQTGNAVVATTTQEKDSAVQQKKGKRSGPGVRRHSL